MTDADFNAKEAGEAGTGSTSPSSSVPGLSFSPPRLCVVCRSGAFRASSLTLLSDIDVAPDVAKAAAVAQSARPRRTVDQIGAHWIQWPLGYHGAAACEPAA